MTKIAYGGKDPCGLMAVKRIKVFRGLTTKQCPWALG